MIVVDVHTSTTTNSVTSLLSSVYPGSAYYGVSGNTGADPKETIWLCKICGEQREMWKKSGAWFFKVGIGFILIRGPPQEVGSLFPLYIAGYKRFCSSV